MKMHNALTARPVIDRLDDLLGDCRPPANLEPQRVDVIVAPIDLDTPAKREQPSRRAGIAVPTMPPLATSPWTQHRY